MKKTPLKRHTPLSSKRTSLAKRTRLRKVGRIGEANIEANRRLKETFNGASECEIKLEGCLGNWPLQFVHRHKRGWYKGDVEKLSDYRQVVIGCLNCHAKIEFNASLTEEVFNKLRGDE